MTTPAHPAATAIVLRQREDDAPALETFLLLRPGSGAFAGAHVFPGGRVDDTDADPAWSTRCDGTTELYDRLSPHLPPALALAHAVAAARETFEETGLLVADSPDLGPEALAEGRRALLARDTTFLDWCVRHGVRPAADRFVPWAHWITPEVEARRFDTWFFVATAPSGQSAAILPGEALAGEWMSVRGALAALEAGAIFLAPPTLRTLEELSGLDSLDAVATTARDRRLTTVMPWRLPGVEPPTLVIPGDAAHATPGPAGILGPSRFVLRGRRWRSEEGPAASRRDAD